MLKSTFDKVKDYALRGGLSEGEATAYAAEFIEVLGQLEAAESVSCDCGCTDA
jgi:hypothetical protein